MRVPEVGEHNREIYHGLLAMDVLEIQKLEAEKVI
jgi:crotonobetainyl-CoA:carnitine CoA-transferase CaiB-like acyl-CoA transferase